MHIYHTALTLTPRRSIVQKLYKPLAQPFVRVVYGLPASWDSKTAVAAFDLYIKLAVWSPCNRFIAIGSKSTVDILDSATLQRIQRLNFPPTLSSLKALAFSPGSRMLTAFYGNHLGSAGAVVSLDLQTGGVVRTIKWKEPCLTNAGNAQIMYSLNGKMVAVLSRDSYLSPTISIHDVVSGVSMPYIIHGARSDLDLNSKTSHVYKIWTHGELLRFATAEPTGIIIWEVGFTSGAAPTEVESIPIPDNLIRTYVSRSRHQDDIKWAEFHPVSCRFAFADAPGGRGALIVWDARASECLLHNSDIHPHSEFMSFSPDARFLACRTIGSEVYLWKESPTGYTLFEKLIPGIPDFWPGFSPNGESIIAFGHFTIHLWHKKCLTTTTSSILAPAPQHTGGGLILEFLPNTQLAVFTRREDERVTVLDLESGAPKLAINTSMAVYGLRPIGNTIVVIGKDAVIAWNLPGGNFLPDARMDVKDSTWKIDLGSVDYGRVIAASISPDSQYVARLMSEGVLDVCSTSTRQNLWVEVERSAGELWFVPGGHDIWCATEDGGAEVFTPTQDTLDRTNSVADIEDGRWGCPWGSRCGYKVTDDGWILGARGKRLFMLPSLWQSPRKAYRVWNGKFVVLLHGGPPEPVILELEP